MSTRWRRVGWFLLGCMGTALLLAVLYALLQGAETTQAIRTSQVDNHKLLDTITDCTQPSGKCYQRGQARTGDAVSSINRVVILAAACAVGKTGPPHALEAQIQSCVIDGLARRKSTR